MVDKTLRGRLTIERHKPSGWMQVLN